MQLGCNAVLVPLRVPTLMWVAVAPTYKKLPLRSPSSPCRLPKHTDQDMCDRLSHVTFGI
jgi:hypothetical protein